MTAVLRSLAAIVLLGLAACMRSSPRLAVGCKTTTEQSVLREVIALHLERRLNIEVSRPSAFLSSQLAHQALMLGTIDLYPEYFSNAFVGILKLPPETDRGIITTRVTEHYRSQFRLERLSPLGFDARFALAAGPDTGAFTSIEEALAQPGAWRLGTAPEFQERRDGFPLLMKSYNLKLSGPVRALEPPQLIKALREKQIDLAGLRESDGLLADGAFRVLKDGKNAFGPADAAIVVRQDTLQRIPELRRALEELSGKIQITTMRALNREVEGGRPAATVASEFLKQASLPGLQ